MIVAEFESTVLSINLPASLPEPGMTESATGFSFLPVGVNVATLLTGIVEPPGRVNAPALLSDSGIAEIMLVRNEVIGMAGMRFASFS